MENLNILKMGEKRLQTRSQEVEVFSNALENLVETLHQAMQKQGGVGISAPQIGINKRVIIYGFEKSQRYPNEKPVPLTVLVNPVLTTLTDEVVEGWEGCLSVPGLRGKVPRYLEIHYAGYTPSGEKKEGIATGFHARILQHECDHLDGILFPERIKDLKNFGFEDIVWANIYGQAK
ncbi:MAG: peptide deformylase [Gammaproteobacteria bacterium]